jgi:hypothetical protein
MSEGDEENDSDRVKPLDAKQGGEEKGTIGVRRAKIVRKDKK